MKTREPIWWLPLLRRVVGWGAAMALLWAVPGMLIAVPLLVSLMTNDIHAGVGYASVVREIYVFLIVISSCVPAGLGLIAGLLSGFYAPPSERANPLASAFFRDVGLEAFLFSLASFFLAALSTLFFINLVGSLFLVLAPVLALVLFALGLQRALNRALRPTKLK